MWPNLKTPSGFRRVEHKKKFYNHWPWSKICTKFWKKENLEAAVLCIFLHNWKFQFVFWGYLTLLNICLEISLFFLPRINPFPHNNTCWCLWERCLLKTWEKEKLLLQAISPFPTMFSTISKTEIIIFVISNLSSANAFNLVRSKILSCGKGWSAMIFVYKSHDLCNMSSLTISQTSLVFTCLQYKPFENTVEKGEIARNEQFLLFPKCFLPVGWLSAIFVKFEIVVCKLFQFGRL